MRHAFAARQVRRTKASCWGKFSYQSEAKAKQAVILARSRGGEANGHYFCRHCDAFHITSHSGSTT